MAPLDSEPRAYRKNDEVMEETDNNSSDSEYEGEEDGLSSEKRFRERMDELLASLRTKTYEDLTNEGEKAHKSLINESEEYYHDLIDKHKTWICPQTKQIQKAVPIRFRNVPFNVVFNGLEEFRLPSFIRAIVQMYPELLAETDGGGLGAIHHAIERKSEWFIKAILDSNISEQDMQSALDPTGSQEGQEISGQNCIHAAIMEKNMNPELTVELIKRASKHTLAAQGNGKLTPLHLAVHYKRCISFRKDIVKTLLQYGDQALDKRTGPPNHYSVYRYHEFTRSPKKKPTVAKPAPDSNGGKSETHKSAKMEMPDPKSLRQVQEEAIQKSMNDKMRKPQKERQKEQEKEKQRDLTEVHTCPGGPRRSSTVNVNNANEGRQLIQASAKEHDANGTARKSRPTGSKHSSINIADDIAKELKLHYFRSIFAKDSGRNHASAEEFIFGDNPKETLISFTFPPTVSEDPEMIDFDQFKGSYQHFIFDSALLYVRFGKLELPLSDDPRAEEGRKYLGSGKRDLEKFFLWLSVDKRVQNIIKVTVEDLQDVPHCDEAIINSLKHFEVEILDWRKFDLCPFAIREAVMKSKHFHEVHLWWSGNNAVLRAWSAQDGLATMTSLKRIHLHYPALLLDSKDYTKQRFDDFESRLQPIEVVKHPFGGSDTQLSTSPSFSSDEKHRTQEGKKMDEHQWLTTMDKFAKAIHGLRELKSNHEDYFTQTISGTPLPDELKRDVTVALIDDGVTYMHPAVSDKLLCGKSFDSGFGKPDSLGTPEPYYGSTTGHGTFMAYMIQRVCPDVKIFVYRIDVLRRADGSVSFTAKSAADAVEHAMNRGFDIVSMSWTVEPNQTDHVDNSPDIKRLRSALQNASRKGKVLLFCSAPDIGQSSQEDTHFPFNCADAPKMFRIGAAKADGTKHPQAGNQVGYILPGENVSMRPDDMANPNEDKIPRTGSSVATALAAGLAAMIIHCVRLGAVHDFHKNNTGGLSWKSVEAIKTFAAMKVAFDIIGKIDSSDNNYRRLEVESIFKEHGVQLSSSSELSDQEKWIKVAKLARNLISDHTETSVK